MPRLSYRHITESTMLGGLIIMVFALACAFAAMHGGPAWMAGNEFEVFVKLAFGTLGAMVIDLCWKAEPAQPRPSQLLQSSRQHYPL